MPPRKQKQKDRGSARQASPTKAVPVAGDVAPAAPAVPVPVRTIDITPTTIMRQPVEVLQALLSARRYFVLVAGLLAVGNLVLGAVTIRKVACELRRGWRG
jgi:hypothetical protein